MKIFIVGNRGQLGNSLHRALSEHEVQGFDLPELDITDREALTEAIRVFAPAVVINAAAYTNVDGCVANPELAYRANALGPHNLALICAQLGIDLVHISTNEVFAGDRPNSGYNEWDLPSPINAYGNSKAAGEFNVRSIHARHYIVRTAWLYAEGGKNFIHKLLQFAENGEVRVVMDEVGNPTYVEDLAQAIGRLILTQQYGTYHFVNEGGCSRWEFANEILRLSGLTHIPNTPISRQEFQRASTPPPYCTLYNNIGRSIGITLRPWQEALAAYLSA